MECPGCLVPILTLVPVLEQNAGWSGRNWTLAGSRLRDSGLVLRDVGDYRLRRTVSAACLNILYPISPHITFLLFSHPCLLPSHLLPTSYLSYQMAAGIISLLQTVGLFAELVISGSGTTTSTFLPPLPPTSSPHRHNHPSPWSYYCHHSVALAVSTQR